MFKQLTSKKAKALRLVTAESEWEWLALHTPDRKAAAIPVLRRVGGLLVCLPDGAITAEEEDAGHLPDVIPELGPVKRTMVGQEGLSEPTIAVVFIDIQEANYGALRFCTRKRVVWEEGTLQFLDGEEVAKPDGPQIVGAAQAWVEGEDGPALDEYLSAVEAPPSTPTPPVPPGMDLVLAQLTSLAEVVGTLQARLAGPPPRTRAAATVPQQAAGLDGEELSEQELALLEEGHSAMSTDQMLRLALVKALGKGSKSKKKVGLALGDSSDEEEEDPLRKLSGARGTLLQERLRQGMDAAPLAYVASIESMAAACLGQAQATQDTMERFVREELPIGSSRDLGYMVWAVVKALNLMRSKQHDKAQLVLMLTLAAVEQYRLDQNWQSAWRLTHLGLPPFQEWKVREHSVQQLRLDHAHSRLIHATWAAAITARLKDEEVLIKRRGAPKAFPKAEKGEKGKGRGRKPEQEEQSAELFPIPVPFPWTPSEVIHGCSRRKRKRWRLRRALEVLVNLQIAGLNFIFGKAGPWHYGIPLLASQQIVVDNLLLRARSLSRLGGHVFSGCGSTVETTATELERLHVLFSDQSDDIPYGSPLGFQRKKSKDSPAAVVPTVASSVAFPDSLQGFNPLPFLDSDFAQAYHDPSVLLHGHSKEPVRMMPPDAVSAATRAELLQLGKRWDRVGRLCLALPQEIDQQDRLLGTHQHLQAMGRLCTCDHDHVKLEGSYAQAAAAYPFPMCEHVARIVVEGCEATQPRRLNPPDGVQHVDVPAGDPSPLRDCRTSQKFVSHLWATQLSESLPWKVCKKYKFLKGGHINVLECHARRSLLLNIPAQQRIVVLQDSMVTLGASAKGRSSSQSLNKVLKQECAICVAKDLYVGGIHSPTWALRADDPSRGRSVRLPRTPLPGWFLDLRAGRLTQAQDSLDDLSETPRSLGRWFLFAAAAFLASTADFNTISDWTSSNSRPSKQGRSGARKSAGSDCNPETPALCRLRRLDQNSAACASEASGKFGKGHTHSSCRVAGGVRTSSVREGGESSHFCRDNQCYPAKVSFLEDDDDWPLAAGNYLGKFTSNASTSSDSETSPGSYGEHRHFLEVASPGTAAFDEFLHFAAKLPKGSNGIAVTEEQTSIVFEEFGKSGMNKISFLKAVQEYGFCIKDVTMTSSFSIEDSKEIRKLLINENVEILEGPKDDSEAKVARVRCRALKDGKIGWVTIKGALVTPEATAVVFFWHR
eukprot:Skav200096  [mRNA]  locus=scaffold694:326558:340569:- [translate_table: standard]